jgi:hypothetical protein
LALVTVMLRSHMVTSRLVCVCVCVCVRVAFVMFFVVVACLGRISRSLVPVPKLPHSPLVLFVLLHLPPGGKTDQTAKAKRAAPAARR